MWVGGWAWMALCALEAVLPIMGVLYSVVWVWIGVIRRRAYSSTVSGRCEEVFDEAVEESIIISRVLSCLCLCLCLHSA